MTPRLIKFGIVGMISAAATQAASPPPTPPWCPRYDQSVQAERTSRDVCEHQSRRKKAVGCLLAYNKSLFYPQKVDSGCHVGVR